MLSHKAIKHEDLQRLLQLRIRLPKQRLATLQFIRENHLRKGLFKLTEQQHLLRNGLRVIFPEILVVDPEAAKLKQISQQISNVDMNCGP